MQKQNYQLVFIDRVKFAQFLINQNVDLGSKDLDTEITQTENSSISLAYNL